MTPEIAIRNARPVDQSDVERLLKSCSLPVAGLEHSFPSGYCIAELEGLVVGLGGMERYGTFGLLRSVAVDPRYQSKGMGGKIVQNRIEWARENGLTEIFLLTDTAPAFFARIGFIPADRAKIPQDVRNSEEFRSICPESACVMRLAI